MKRSTQSGVTLLELLVAVMLLALLSVGILFAARIGFNSMERVNSRMMGNRKIIGVEKMLLQQIAGFMPVKAACRAMVAPFFHGEEQTMRFVSSYSLQEAARGLPRILVYQVMPGENGAGVRLVVNEFLYTGPQSAGAGCLGPSPNPPPGEPTLRFAPVEPGPQSFVLADKLQYCRFVYREQREDPLPERWHPRWIRQRAPSAVRIEFAPLEPDPSKLQLTAITAPLRPNRDPMADYSVEP